VKTKEHDYIKEAEERVVAVARQWSDAMSICTALANFGNRMCHEYVGKKDFFDGLQLMRNAMRHEYTEAIESCFMFSGVGGKKAEKLSLEMFRETFDSETRYSVIQFLSDNGHAPGSWYADEEEEFRKQAIEKCRQED